MLIELWGTYLFNQPEIHDSSKSTNKLTLPEVTKKQNPPPKWVTFYLKWVTGTAWYGASSTCSHPLTPSSLDDLPNSQTSKNSKGVQNKARGLKRNTSQIELRFLEWHGIIQCGSCYGCFLLLEVYGYDISHRQSPPYRHSKQIMI